MTRNPVIARKSRPYRLR